MLSCANILETLSRGNTSKIKQAMSKKLSQWSMSALKERIQRATVFMSS